ncbi:phospholipase A and acyltransferase 4-like [Cololabis saira]|uniref:phospholipase A and acyltransferase 4-like n=1 Tax=Cololabis saira TaxID=129043 RepID=UPI002AD4D8EA|nr:phospholipase A and acyltransferase 4-like [Cololabis saira]
MRGEVRPGCQGSEQEAPTRLQLPDREPQQEAISSSSAASIRKFFDKDKKQANPGDLIETKGYLFNHWAVYVGGGNVVHFTKPGGGSGSVSGGGGGFVGEGKVLKEKLEDVVKEDKWIINNLLDHKYTPRPADEIVKNACSMVDTNLHYHLLDYNCEHFATEMRYNKRESQQAENIKAKIGLAAVKVCRYAARVALGESASR